MKDIRPKLLAVFQAEHKEHLGRIRAILANLDREGLQPANGEWDEAFRRAHSLKGAARAVDLNEVQTLAHRLETLFSRVREGKVRLEKPLVAVIHQVLDATEDWVSALAENRSPADSAPVLRAIEQVLGLGPVTATSPVETPSSTPITPNASGRNRREEAPTPEPAPASPTSSPARTSSSTSFQPVETVRVNAEDLDQLLRSTGQLLTESLQQEIIGRELAEFSQQIRQMEKEWERVRKSSGTALHRLGATPQFSRIAHHLNSMGQQAHSLSRRARGLRLLQQRSSWTLRNLGEQLQQDVRRTRMVPVESVFEGFRKMMRDLARDENKEFEFLAIGFDVEADRMVLQSLKDSVMHLLRNAVSHGIEAPSEREKAGKNRAGRVTLQIDVHGNRLRILVDDDGRGLNLKRVAEVAVERGLIPKSAAPPPSDLAQVIFQPGFSTAESITELSGRGMGLSIVAEAVARLQGEVAVQPKPGPGNAILMTVPLSVSTHRLLLVTCQKQTFGIPVHGIQCIERVKIHELETMEGKPVVRLLGQIIPLLTLASLLGIGEPGGSTEGEIVPVVILKSGDHRVAVAVNALLVQVDGLIKDLGPHLARVPNISGGILLGDGSVALVLNPTELIAAAKEANPARSLTTAKSETDKKPPSILVVDDSITTRTLEKSILEAHGYHVNVAVDGMEALAQLRAKRADLIISDVEMPCLDGFGLLEEVKKDKDLSQIPVILVTSMESRAHQERGLALGADAYIVKRKFDQRDLLETIRQML